MIIEYWNFEFRQFNALLVLLHCDGIVVDFVTVVRIATTRFINYKKN